MTVWINTLFDALPGEGGRPMRYWLLARALAAAGHRVVMWSGDFHHVTKRKRVVAAAYEAEGIQVRLVPVMPYSRNVCWRRWRSHARYARDWEAAARGERDRPDVIVLALPPPEVFGAAERLRQAWGCKIAADIQDAWPETFYRLLPRGLRWLGPVALWPMRRAAQRAYRGSDAVSAVAERYRALAPGAAVFPLGRLLRPRSGLNGESKSSGLNGENKNGEGIRLCYVGNLGAGYDIGTVLEGVRRLAAEDVAATLDVAGDGPLRGRVERFGAPVRYAGYLNEKAMEALLASCDIGVVPMFPESQVAVPNKLVDYAAAGLAVINGLAGEAQELLDRYQAGVAYRPGDVLSFVAAMRRYADDRHLLAQHRRGAVRLAEEQFDAERIYREMAGWLAKIKRRE
jgi:glycosyltransferase involved in cell wall biosynthesis